MLRPRSDPTPGKGRALRHKALPMAPKVTESPLRIPPQIVIAGFAAIRLAVFAMACRVLAVLASLSMPAASTQWRPLDPRALPVTTAPAQRLQSHVSFLASPDYWSPTGNARQPPGCPIYRRTISSRRTAATSPRLAAIGRPFRIGWATMSSGDPADRSPARTLDCDRGPLRSSGYPFLGADDNASSIAIPIETARNLTGLSPRHHVCRFNGEELPYFGTAEMGSQFCFTTCRRKSALRKIFAAIIMDLMGGVHWAPLKDAIFATGRREKPCVVSTGH